MWLDHFRQCLLLLLPRRRRPRGSAPTASVSVSASGNPGDEWEQQKILAQSGLIRSVGWLVERKKNHRVINASSRGKVKKRRGENKNKKGKEKKHEGSFFAAKLLLLLFLVVFFFFFDVYHAALSFPSCISDWWRRWWGTRPRSTKTRARPSRTRCFVNVCSYPLQKNSKLKMTIYAIHPFNKSESHRG